MEDVKKHYDEKTTYSLHEKRETSKILNIRNINNAVKQYLFGNLGPDDRVLDLCIGRGGDLHKYFHANIKLLAGADISSKCIDECANRYQGIVTREEKRRGRVYGALFSVNDCH